MLRGRAARDYDVSPQAILLPLFVDVVLTFVLMSRLGVLCTAQAANTHPNQFELSVLFYVLTILALFTRHAGFLFVILAWVFVIVRVLQAYGHWNADVLRLRGTSVSIAMVVLMIMWAIYIIEMLTGVML